MGSRLIAAHILKLNIRPTIFEKAKVILDEMKITDKYTLNNLKCQLDARR